MVNARILLETLRQADGGKVVCTVATPEGPVQGTISSSFFEEFTGGTEQPQLTEQPRLRIINENVGYLEPQAASQLRMGHREVIIR